MKKTNVKYFNNQVEKKLFSNVKPRSGIKVVNARTSSFKLLMNEKIKNNIINILNEVILIRDFNFIESNLLDYVISFAIDDADLIEKAKEKFSAYVFEKNDNNFDIEEYNEEILTNISKELDISTLYILLSAIDSIDHYTFGHSIRVSWYASQLAKYSGFSKAEVEQVRQASLLHDLGKIGIMEFNISNIRDESNVQNDFIMQHINTSKVILKYLSTYENLLTSITEYHERWDGKGYPYHLKGDKIPLASRCIAIAKSFDQTLTKGNIFNILKKEEALDEIIKNSGKIYDPKLVRNFVRLIRSNNYINDEGTNYSISTKDTFLRIKNFEHI